MHAYLIDKFAMAVKMARYVEGDVFQAETELPSDPMRIPAEATMLDIARASAKRPDNGPNRIRVFCQARGSADLLLLLLADEQKSESIDCEFARFTVVIFSCSDMSAIVVVHTAPMTGVCFVLKFDRIGLQLKCSGGGGSVMSIS